MGEKYSSNCVSIPQGPINTDPFGRDTPGITLFQFRKVQLIPERWIIRSGKFPVSIPQGPINTALLGRQDNGAESFNSARSN